MTLIEKYKKKKDDTKHKPVKYISIYPLFDGFERRSEIDCISHSVVNKIRDQFVLIEWSV